MNIFFKPFFLGLYLTVSLAIMTSSIISILLTNNYIVVKENINNDAPIYIDAVSKLEIEEFKKVKEIKKKTIKIEKKSGRYLLKEFSISGISFDGDDSMVIIRDTVSNNFLSIGESLKGYKLEEVYVTKAIFTKNGDEYYSFLSPDEEKEFKEISAVKGGNKVITTREKVTGSVAKSMFEDVEYKNGTYYIPQDTILDFKDLKKIFRSISIKAYNTSNNIKYKVLRVNPKSVFAKIGLQKDDYIIAIDNNKFKSVMEPIKYFNNLQNIKSMNLTIKRGKETKELKYEIF